MNHKKIIDIHNILTKENNIDVVLIQIGGWFEIIEESAYLLSTDFGLKIQDNGGLRPYNLVRFPVKSLNKYYSLLESTPYTYCFVEEIDRAADLVRREIRLTSNTDLVGMQFEHILK